MAVKTILSLLMLCLLSNIPSVKSHKLSQLEFDIIINDFEDYRCRFKTMEYNTAMDYIDDYRINSVENEKFVYEVNGVSQAICIDKGISLTRDLFLSSAGINIGGVQLLYGMSNSDDSRKRNRYGIFLPLDSDGEKYTLNDDSKIYYLKLNSRILDPCPDDCDY